MPVTTRGFHGRRPGPESEKLPPGQYLTRDFPVLAAGPTPRVTTDRWRLTITTETGARRVIDWAELMRLPSETITVDIHCVTTWSKLATTWRGVPLDVIFEQLDTAAQYAMVHSYGGYTTNVPVADLLYGRSWIAYEYAGKPLHPEHGGPARLLVPHLYFWKSAKWVDAITLSTHDADGFWERAGYHHYGDPWREQRYAGD